MTAGLPIYFLLHLPKAAGQTLTGHLAEHSAPGRYLEPRRAKDIPADPAARDSLRALSGHWLSRAMEERFAGRDIRQAAMLRDPVAAQVSLYNFRQMIYAAKGLGRYSFRFHLAAQPRNFLTHFILSRWLGHNALAIMWMSDAQQFATVDAELARFWHVGPHDGVDALIATIAPDLDIPPVAQARNRTADRVEFSSVPPLSPEMLDPATRAQIVREHAVDQALYDKWVSGTSPQALATRRQPVRALARLAADGWRLFLRDWSGLSRIGQNRLVARATAARARGDWAAAATMFERAIGRSGGSPLLWIDLARALRELERPTEALTAYDRALALRPGMPSVLVERAELQAAG